MTALPLFAEDEAARAEAEAKRLAAELEQRRRWAEHDADFTPPDVCRLGAWAVREIIGLRPRRILGPCAGGGAWLAASREFFPDAELHAQDIREEEREHIEHHVGAKARVRIGDFIANPPRCAPDLILDNLPFKYALDFMQQGIDELADGGWAVWFVRQTLGDADAVNEFFERHPYAYELDYVDRFKFRVGINPENGKPWGVDNVGYKLIAFHKTYKPRMHLGKRLPSLPPDSRRWRKTRAAIDVRPGTEYMHADIEPPAWSPP